MTSDPSAADIYGRDFPAGAVLFEEGDPASRMYVIRAGEVRIVKRIGARELELARLGPGEAFGEMARLAPGAGAAAPGSVHEYLALERRFEPEERRRDPT